MVKLINRISGFISFSNSSKHSDGFFASFKYVLKYIKYSKPNVSSLNVKLPWYTYSSIDYLSEVLNKEFDVFEFGTGGSSFYYSSRVRRVECVEHDLDWYNLVINNIQENRIENIFCELKTPQKSINPDLVYKSIVFEDLYRDLSFEQYCKFIDTFPDNHFDLIAIDGRARIGSFKHSLSKVKHTGFILIDNSERNEYNAIRDILVDAGWVEKTFKGPGPYSEKFWQTSIWKR